MDPHQCEVMLRENARRVASLAEGVGDYQARWKPDAETWSVLEVVNHLWEEEQLDFRVRLEYILYRPGEDFPPIDPPGWVIAHAYNERELESSLQGYLDERKRSLAWLEGLGEADWDTKHPHAEWATAGNILASWAAHDILHMRQLVELHWAWTTRQTEPYDTRYAGDW